MAANASYLEHVLKAIRENQLRAFRWDDGDLNNEDACALADALMHNTSVTEIDLSSNQVGDEGFVALGEMLKYKQNIQLIDVRNNKMGDEGCVALAEGVRHLPDLHTLITMNNDFSMVGCIALKNAIVGGDLKNITAAPISLPEVVEYCQENFRRARKAFQPFPLPDLLEPERLRDMAERWPAITRSYCNTATLEVVQEMIAAMPMPDLSQPDAVAALKVQQGDYRAVDNPLVWQKLNLTVETLNEAGMQLQKDALLTADGEPTEIFERAIGSGRVRHLFTYENWEGASKAELQSALRVLPEETFIPNRQQLLSIIGREERQQAQAVG